MTPPWRTVDAIFAQLGAGRQPVLYTPFIPGAVGIEGHKRRLMQPWVPAFAGASG